MDVNVNKKLFGTDGVRGVANQKMTPELAYNIGKATALIYNTNKRGKIIIGKDNRKSSDMLETAFISGALSHGANVERIGVITSAGVCYLAKQLRANAGVMITASHNPAEYNGIKIFNGNGVKLTDTQQTQIEQIVYKNRNLKVKNRKIGALRENFEAISEYMSFLKNSIYGDFEDFYVCIDCANGAGSEIVSKVFKDLKIKHKRINKKKNSLLINKSCGATHPNFLSKTVKDGNFNIGFALDGDADRLVVVDSNGEVISGDDILFLIANYLKAKGELKNNIVVGTVMTNYSLEQKFKEQNIKLIRTKVGDRFVVKEMIKQGANLGGEQSGHFVFFDKLESSDGVLSALQILKVLRDGNLSLKNLPNTFIKMPQILVNIKVSESDKWKVMKSEELLSEIKDINDEFKGEGRLVVRASGTENVIRIMVESFNEKKLKKAVKRVQNCVKTQKKL